MTKAMRASGMLAVALMVGATIACSPPAAAEPRAAAAKGEAYTVQHGDTLSRIAGSRLGDAAAWKRLQALNRIENPDVLRPGTTIYLPAGRRSPAAVDAEVIMVKGEARVRRRPDGPAVPLSAGTRLAAGEVIETGTTGLLTLRFADGSRMLVSPDSRLTLLQMELNAVSGAATTRAKLESGDIESFVSRLRGIKARYEVKTPSLNLAVRGTVFRVQFDEMTGEARASVSEGEVKAANAFGEAFIPAGSGIAASPGRPPAAPHPLLPPPEFDGPAPTVDGFPLRFSWRPLPGAQRYRVELHERGTDDRLAEARAVEDMASRWRHLPNGEYRLRVRGVDDRKLDGLNAEFAFKVQAWPAPPLTAVPADGVVMASERVKFRWARAADAEYLCFQVATDSGFKQLAADLRNLTGRSNGVTLPLAPGRYFWRIAAGSAADGLGPFGPVQSFEVGNAGAEAASRPRLLRWRAGAPGERYAVQIARQGDFTAPLVDVELDTARVLVPEGAGLLFVRIKRIAVDGFGGEFETAQVFDPQD